MINNKILQKLIIFTVLYPIFSKLILVLILVILRIYVTHSINAEEIQSTIQIQPSRHPLQGTVPHNIQKNTIGQIFPKHDFSKDVTNDNNFSTMFIDANSMISITLLESNPYDCSFDEYCKKYYTSYEQSTLYQIEEILSRDICLLQRGYDLENLQPLQVIILQAIADIKSSRNEALITLSEWPSNVNSDFIMYNDDNTATFDAQAFFDTYVNTILPGALLKDIAINSMGFMKTHLPDNILSPTQNELNVFINNIEKNIHISNDQKGCFMDFKCAMITYNIAQSQGFVDDNKEVYRTFLNTIISEDNE